VVAAVLAAASVVLFQVQVVVHPAKPAMQDKEHNLEAAHKVRVEQEQAQITQQAVAHFKVLMDYQVAAGVIMVVHLVVTMVLMLQVQVADQDILMVHM
jgi:hypothetical protein